MTTFVFANNINTSLASSVSSSATSITLSSGFNLPASIPSGQVLAITLNDAATQQVFEVVYATAISGTTLTVLRAQEGTTAQAWAAGDYVFSGPTAGQMESLQSGIGSGVTSWNTRTGAVDPATGDYTWSMIGGTFPYVASFNSRVGNIVLSGSDVTTALGYTPVETVAVASANGVSGSVSISGATQTVSLTLGAITPSSVSCTGASSAGSYSTNGTLTCGGATFTPLAGKQIHINYDGNNQVLVAQAPGGGTTYQPLGIYASNVYMTGTASVAGAFTCGTMNATGSDRRLKRDIKKVAPRPLHRSVPFVSFVLKESGWHGLGSIAQVMQKSAPEHVGEFDWHRKKRLSLNYAGAAYEESMWCGHEIDALRKRVAELERIVLEATRK